MKSFKIICLSLFVSLVGWANPGDGIFDGKYTKEKKINKDYTVNAEATLNISNKYGNVNIVSWNENRVVIEVTIKTNGNNEKKTQERLDKIKVEFKNASDYVSAKTVIENSDWNWGWSSSNVSIQIDYLVKMPVRNLLILKNDYGSISLDKLDNKVDINCDYGSMNIGELNASDNKLNFDYTNGVTIDYVKSAYINADYSGYTIDKAGKLTINADYTKSVIRLADQVNFNADYGSILIGKANYIDGNGDYLSQEYEKVVGSLKLVSDYGSIKIRSVAAGFKDINIKSDYVSIKIGLEPQAAFNFSIKARYASLKGIDGLNFNKKIQSGSDNYYEGTYGQNPSGKITIDSNYGNINLNTN